VVQQVTRLFLASELDAHGDITLEVFKSKLESNEMKQLFQAVEVDISDAETLFRILDVDDTGALSPDELIQGWFRLRGPAKALDLALLMAETDRADRRILRNDAETRQLLSLICVALDVRDVDRLSPVKELQTSLQGATGQSLDEGGDSLRKSLRRPRSRDKLELKRADTMSSKNSQGTSL